MVCKRTGIQSYKMDRNRNLWIHILEQGRYMEVNFYVNLSGKKLAVLKKEDMKLSYLHSAEFDFLVMTF
jgi:hypothetical protein